MSVTLSGVCKGYQARLPWGNYNSLCLLYNLNAFSIAGQDLLWISDFLCASIEYFSQSARYFNEQVRDVIAVIDLRILGFENGMRISLATSLEEMLEDILSSEEFLEDFLGVSCEFIFAN